MSGSLLSYLGLSRSFFSHNHISSFPGSCLHCSSLEMISNARRAVVAVGGIELVLCVLPQRQVLMYIEDQFYPVFSACSNTLVSKGVYMCASR